MTKISESRHSHLRTTSKHSQKYHVSRRNLEGCRKDHWCGPGLAHLLRQETGRESHHRPFTPRTWLMWTSPFWQALRITVCQNKQRKQTHELFHSTGHHTHAYSDMWYVLSLNKQHRASHDPVSWPTKNIKNKKFLSLQQLLWIEKKHGSQKEYSCFSVFVLLFWNLCQSTRILSYVIERFVNPSSEKSDSIRQKQKDRIWNAVCLNSRWWECNMWSNNKSALITSHMLTHRPKGPWQFRRILCGPVLIY